MSNDLFGGYKPAVDVSPIVTPQIRERSVKSDFAEIEKLGASLIQGVNAYKDQQVVDARREVAEAKLVKAKNDDEAKRVKLAEEEKVYSVSNSISKSRLELENARATASAISVDPKASEEDKEKALTFINIDYYAKLEGEYKKYQGVVGAYDGKSRSKLDTALGKHYGTAIKKAREDQLDGINKANLTSIVGKEVTSVLSNGSTITEGYSSVLRTVKEKYKTSINPKDATSSYFASLALDVTTNDVLTHEEIITMGDELEELATSNSKYNLRDIPGYKKLRKALVTLDNKATTKRNKDVINTIQEYEKTKEVLPDIVTTNKQFGPLKTNVVNSKESWVASNSIPGYVAALITKGDSPKLAKIKEKALLEKQYAYQIVEDLDGTHDVAISTIADQTVKTVYSTKVKQEVVNAYEEGNFDVVQDINIVNPEVVTTMLKPQIGAEISTVFLNTENPEEVHTNAKKLVEKIDAMGSVGWASMTPLNRATLQAMATDGTKLNRIMELRSGKISLEDYTYSDKDFYEAMSGMPADMIGEAKEQLQLFGILYGDSLSQEELMERVLDTREENTLTNAWNESSYEISLSSKVSKSYPKKDALTGLLKAYGVTELDTATVGIVGANVYISTKDPMGQPVTFKVIPKESFDDSYTTRTHNIDYARNKEDLDKKKATSTFWKGLFHTETNNDLRNPALQF